MDKIKLIKDIFGKEATSRDIDVCERNIETALDLLDERERCVIVARYSGKKLAEVSRGIINIDHNGIDPYIGVTPSMASFLFKRGMNKLKTPTIKSVIAASNTIPLSAIAIALNNSSSEPFESRINKISASNKEAEDIRNQKADVSNNTPISIYSDILSTRAMNGLSMNDIYTIGELRGLSFENLLSLRNIGRKSCLEIMRFIEGIDTVKKQKRR